MLRTNPALAREDRAAWDKRSDVGGRAGSLLVMRALFGEAMGERE